MNQLKQIISDSKAQFGDGVEVKMWARAFAGWETDEVPKLKYLNFQNFDSLMPHIFLGNRSRAGKKSVPSHGLRFLHYIPLDCQLHGMFIGPWLCCPHTGN